MHGGPQIFSKKAVMPITNQVGDNYMQNASIAFAFGGTNIPPSVEHSRPFHGVEFQSTELCPKNFIIFDKTDKRSQIMFHPTFVPKFCHSGFNINSSYFEDDVEKKYACNEKREVSYSLNEDSEDIDALLSLEEEDQEECDDEEVSTARTHGNYGSDSPNSCSTYGSKPRKSGLPPLQASSGSGSNYNSERQRRKMRKMLRTLRGIIPSGGNRMNTAAVLDEAIRYLKSLKVEVQKLGMGNLKN